MNVSETDVDYGILSKSDRWDKIRAIALAIQSVTLILVCIALIAVSSVANKVEHSSECRFDKTADISDTNDLLDYWTWVGLRATATGNDAELANAVEQGDKIARKFEANINARADIVEECS